MLKIRLQRFGKRGQPTFRLVVTDSRNATQSGKFTETLGWYNPRSKEHDIDAEKVNAWIAKGVQLTDSVHNLLVNAGILSAPKKALTGRKDIHGKPASEAPAEEAAPAQEESAEGASAEETPAEEAPAETSDAAEEKKEEEPAQ